MGPEVAAEHRELDVLFAEAREALEERDGPLARNSLARLDDSLAAHFDRESRLYYPTIWALRPEHKAALTSLVDAHESFLVRLREIRASIGKEPPDPARRAFEEFLGAFALHESAEEDVLRAIEHELDRDESAEH